MAKIIITLEDNDLEMVDISMAFDPPVESELPLTPAQNTAGYILNFLNKNDEGGCDIEIEGEDTNGRPKRTHISSARSN